MFEDRQYQLEDVDYSMAHGPEIVPLHCSPCGSGKSVIQAKIAKAELDRGNRTGILTPRGEIFRQTHSVLNDIVGYENVAMLQAGQYWRRDKPVHLVSWSTLTSRIRRSDLWYPEVDRLLVDEAHLSMAPKIFECLQWYRARGTVIDGYTATPGRKSGKGLGDFFTNIKHVTTVQQLLDDGKLCPPEYWWGKDVRGEKKDGKKGPPLVGDVVDNWLRVANSRHTIVFAMNIPHCEALVDRLNAAGVAAAAFHHGVRIERRAELDSAFKAREIQVLVTVTLVAYGYDAATVDCVVLARRHDSIVFHLQAIGRGMRPYPGKDFFLVIDHGENVMRLGKAEDPYRWRLDSGRTAAENWSRHKTNPKRQPKPHECRNCMYIFERSRTCPKCGWEVPLPKRDVATVPADVKRMSEQKGETKTVGWPGDREFFLQLRHYQEAKGYSFGWVLHKFKAKKMGRGKKRLREDQVPLPPRSWNSLPTIQPEPRVLSWLRSEQIRFVQSRRKKERNAA